jgi:hypothetical protein
MVKKLVSQKGKLGGGKRGRQRAELKDEQKVKQRLQKP